MARVQVYLPDELHARMKDAGLSPSELLQRALRAELRKQELEAAADAYLAELIAEVGEPTEAELERADALVRKILGGSERAAG